jgi:hypothetical protein
MTKIPYLKYLNMIKLAILKILQYKMLNKITKTNNRLKIIVIYSDKFKNRKIYPQIRATLYFLIIKKEFLIKN